MDIISYNHADEAMSATIDIKKPSITSPANGAIDTAVSLTLEGSAYETRDLFVGAKTATQMRVSTSADFAVIAYEGDSATASGLDPSTTYYAQIRYVSTDVISEWSTAVSFTTKDAGITDPTITSPTNGATDNGETVDVITDAYDVFGHSEAHESTDRQIASNSDFSTIVSESVADTTDLTNWTSGALEVSTTYYIRVRYNSASYTSGWSTTVSFATKDEFKIPLQEAGSQGYGTVPSSEPFAVLNLAEMEGTTQEGHDNYGNYIHTNGSIMCYIPKTFYRIGHTDSPNYSTYGENAIDTKGADTFADEAAANSAGYVLHRAFIDNGQEKDGVFIDKYMNSKHSDNAQSVSAFGTNPIGLTTNADYNPSSSMDNATGILADAVTIARARGAGFISAAYYHYGLLALLSVAHAQATTDIANNAWYDDTDTTNFPKGCNSSLSDVNDNSVTYTSAGDGDTNKPLSGATANFAKTTHNGCNNGVADLNGGMYEVAIGLTSAGNSATATTAITNDNIHILKLSSKLADLTGGWDNSTDAWGNTSHLDTLFDAVSSAHALGSTTGTVYWGSGSNAVFSNDQSGINRDTIGFIPKNNSSTDGTGTNQFGNDYLNRYNRMNLAVLCCGRWSRSADAGPFYRYFGYGRSSDGDTCSFRSVAYGS